jgi:pyruvate dehydrogenase E1 component beta subunit
MSTPAELVAAAGSSGPVETLSYREAINLALDDSLAEDPSVVFLGEDVANEGGVFKTNAGLVEKHGARVINTPICENGFTGVALGMAVAGLRPIVEFMFADFLPTAGDAIVNQLPKYRFMSGGRLSVPITLRVISGAGGRFGTQHSATGESWFMSQPGLRVAAAGTPAAAYELLRAAVKANDPVIVHEHKLLYTRKGLVRRGAAAEVGRAAIERRGSDVTIVATMLMVERALQAAEMLAAEGIEAEVIDLRWLSPMDTRTVVDSVRRTGRCLIVQEGSPLGGWSGAVAAAVADEAIDALDAPVRRLTGPDHAIPFAPHLEAQVVPSVDRIVAEARLMVGR